jgi:hypothetical protein
MASPWSFLDEFPPSIVRLMAREGRGRANRWLTDEEVAIASGLTLDRVNELKLKQSWDDVVLSDIRKFCAGCGFDPTSSHDRRTKVYIYYSVCKKQNVEPFLYLRKNPKWREFKRELARAREKQQTG